MTSGNSGVGLGSPPPMRGKATEKYNGVSKKGITPAYAGKSKTHAGMSTPAADHPRLCGEKHIGKKYITAFQGSPPPMRGKAFCGGYKAFCGGITPAYAGKSTFIPQNNKYCEDHPRLCGEKGIHEVRGRVRVGSPPPMRGKARLSGTCRTRARITPAYAGKRDHPLYSQQNG